MKSTSYSELLKKLSNALHEWATYLPLSIPFDNVDYTVDEAFRDAVGIARINLLVKLGAERRSYLAELIDTALNRAIEMGKAFVGACRGVKLPPGVKSWDYVTLDELRVDYSGAIPRNIINRAWDIENTLSECDELFNATDRAIRLADCSESEEGNNHEILPQPRLSHMKRQLLDIVRNAGQRLTKDQILSEISKSGENQSAGTASNYLAQLTSMGTLDNRQDVSPRGYGLPEWG